jgi:hypothetical protein
MSEGPGGDRQAAVEAAQKDISDMRALVKKWEVRQKQRGKRGERKGRRGLMRKGDKGEGREGGVLIEVLYVVCVGDSPSGDGGGEEGAARECGQGREVAQRQGKHSTHHTHLLAKQATRRLDTTHE